VSEKYDIPANSGILKKQNKTQTKQEIEEGATVKKIEHRK
jgi:hypothetical protein